MHFSLIGYIQEIMHGLSNTSRLACSPWKVICHSYVDMPCDRHDNYVYWRLLKKLQPSSCCKPFTLWVPGIEVLYNPSRVLACGQWLPVKQAKATTAPPLVGTMALVLGTLCFRCLSGEKKASPCWIITSSAYMTRIAMVWKSWDPAILGGCLSGVCEK